MTKSINNDIFIAAPLTSFNACDFFLNNKRICDLIKWIRENSLHKNIFYAGENKYKKNNFDNPKIAIQIDLETIHNSKYILFIYPSKVITSAFVEIGYAIALKKKVFILVKRREDLPFILQESDKVYNYIKIYDYTKDSCFEETFKDIVLLMK